MEGRARAHVEKIPGIWQPNISRTRVGGTSPPLPVTLGPEICRIQVPIQCELPRLSDNRCESWWPPPLGRAPQPVSIQTRPVSSRWRALFVWYTYIGICELRRSFPHLFRGTTCLVKSSKKSRIGPSVSKPRDAVPTRHAMEVVVAQRVTETAFFPVLRHLPVGEGMKTPVP